MVRDNAVSVGEMLKKLDYFSTTGYIWHSQMITKVLKRVEKHIRSQRNYHDRRTLHDDALRELPRMIVVPTQTQRFDYASAFRHVAAWASFDKDDVTDLTHYPQEFYGHLGSLDFFYSDDGRVLHAWEFVTPGSGSLLSTRAEVKQTIHQIAKRAFLRDKRRSFRCKNT